MWYLYTQRNLIYFTKLGFIALSVFFLTFILGQHLRERSFSSCRKYTPTINFKLPLPQLSCFLRARRNTQELWGLHSLRCCLRFPFTFIYLHQGSSRQCPRCGVLLPGYSLPLSAWGEPVLTDKLQPLMSPAWWRPWFLVSSSIWEARDAISRWGRSFWLGVRHLFWPQNGVGKVSLGVVESKRKGRSPFPYFYAAREVSMACCFQWEEDCRLSFHSGRK